jgi:hypothetical protein
MERYNLHMSVEARFADGVFKPLGDVTGVVPGKVYRVFSEEEIRSFTEDLAWLKAAEQSFTFWDNDEDAVYDRL